MAILRAGSLVVAGLTAAFAAGAAPPGQSAPKATGDVYFMNGDMVAYSHFNAHEAIAHRPAKGLFYYYDNGYVGDQEGRYYYADLNCVDVDGDYATFSGPLVDTNVPEWMGFWVQIWVHDGGTPGWRGDEITGAFFDFDGCLPYDDPPGWLAVMDGNLVVHE